MPGTNYASAALTFVWLCFVSTLPATQINDARSREAAAILNKAIVQYEKLSEKPSKIKTDIRFKLVSALTRNRQYDEAESILDGAEDWPAKQQFANIGKARIAYLAQSNSAAHSAKEGSQQIDAIKRLFQKSGPHPVWDFSKSIDKLLKDGRVELAMKIIDSSHGDMVSFKPVLGSYENRYYKMSNLAKVAECYYRKGDERSAEKIIENFGQEITRDYARLCVLENCLGKGQVDEAIAETMLEKIESKDQRYRGAFRLTRFFVGEQNLERSIQYAELMDENLAESNSMLHRYHAELLVSVVHLKLSAGENAEYWIERAEELAAEVPAVQLGLICVGALHGDLDSVDDSPSIAMKSLKWMLKFRHRDDSYSPFRFVSAERIVSCSIAMAESFDDPFLRASALCAIAEKIEKTDPQKARQLVLSALEAAKEPEDPRSGQRNSEFNKFHALQLVATRFAQIGESEKAIKTIELIRDKPDPETKTDDVSHTSSEKAFAQMSRHLSKTDSMLKLEASEVFAVIESLGKSSPRKAAAGLSALIGKFVELENWSTAEQLYEKGRESGLSHILPYQIVTEIAETENQQLLREWFERCDDDDKARLLSGFCAYFNVRSRVPESRTVIEVDSMLQELPENESSSLWQVHTFLITGLWTDGFEERARALIDQLEPPSSAIPQAGGRERQVREFAIRANNSDLPELAVLLASTVDDPSEISMYLFKDAYLPRTYERSNELLQDREKLDLLPRAVQISLLLRRAYELMRKAR